MKSETHEGRRWIGRVLRDRWRIDARISRGGVGTVYAATHKNNGSRAAIKVLHPEFARDADTRSRFLQEGYAANQVNHPGVVRILDDDTSEDGHAYLVMELLEGELLETRRVRKGGKLPIPDVYEVGEQLLDVLAAAHDKGIVHRDIKPDNLFVTREGRLKVLDFGFAQMRSQFRPDVTATGFLLGTPGFMSPEQAIGNRAQVDALTDVWAAGATLFTLLSGEPVHDGNSAAEMLVAVANLEPRSLASVASGLPPRLVELVDRAVAFRKEDRWPNARSMQLALRAVSGKQKAGAVSRRSIPDVEPVSEGPTLFEDPMFIEELDPSELVDSSSAPWQHDATEPVGPMRFTGGPSTGRGPSAPPAGTWSTHPADGDGPTVAFTGPTPSDRAPDTKPPTNRSLPPRPTPSYSVPQAMVDPTVDNGTLIMESPVNAEGSGPYPAIDEPPRTSPTPFARQSRAPAPMLHSYAPPEPMRPRATSHPDERVLSTAPRALATRSPPPKSSRALVFLGVVVVTMVVVIVGGMLILTFSD